MVSDKVEVVTKSYKADAPAVRSVSYTHLRAHETVLDIVCRLLLEKKKEIEKNQVILFMTRTGMWQLLIETRRYTGGHDLSKDMYGS